jgi:hypothetical protein
LRGRGGNLPFLALKLNWVLGGTVGMADPSVFDNTRYRVANITTLAMDLTVVLVAVAFTHPRGRRLPARLVLVPVWIASGFLTRSGSCCPSRSWLPGTRRPVSNPARSVPGST